MASSRVFITMALIALLVVGTAQALESGKAHYLTTSRPADDPSGGARLLRDDRREKKGDYDRREKKRGEYCYKYGRYYKCKYGEYCYDGKYKRYYKC